MARKQRDYKAERERRNARAAERGLSRSQARGHPRKGEVPVWRAFPRPRAPERRKVIERGGGKIVRPSASHRTQVRELRRAVKAGRLVSVLITVDMEGLGVEFKTRWVDGRQYAYTRAGNPVVSAQIVIGDFGIDPAGFVDTLAGDGSWDDVLDEWGEEGIA